MKSNNDAHYVARIRGKFSASENDGFPPIFSCFTRDNSCMKCSWRGGLPEILPAIAVFSAENRTVATVQTDEPKGFEAFGKYTNSRGTVLIFREGRMVRQSPQKMTVKEMKNAGKTEKTVKTDHLPPLVRK